MIQPLRVVHRRAFAALAAILPLIIAAGVSGRRSRVSSIPTLPSAPLGASRVSTASVVWEKSSFSSDVFIDSRNSRALILILKSTHELNHPDLLLYWADHDISATAGLSDAGLLGSFTEGKSFLLPNDKQRGVLVLYSLAHREIVDKAKVGGLP